LELAETPINRIAPDDAALAPECQAGMTMLTPRLFLARKLFAASVTRGRCRHQRTECGLQILNER
jgi:hypothetical protein